MRQIRGGPGLWALVVGTVVSCTNPPPAAPGVAATTAQQGSAERPGGEVGAQRANLIVDPLTAKGPLAPRGGEAGPGRVHRGFIALDDGTWFAKLDRFDIVVDGTGTLKVTNGSQHVKLSPEHVGRPRTTRDGNLEIVSSRGIETLRPSQSTLEQSWRFEARPAQTPLAVRMRVDSTQPPLTDARGLHFVSTRGTFHYGHGTWVDANGTRTEIPAKMRGGAITLEVPSDVLARTKWPAVLDPTLSMESAVSTTPATEAAIGFQSQVAMAFDPNSQRVLYVWVDTRRDFVELYGNVVGNIFGAECTFSGDCTNLEWVPISTGVEDREHPQVTFAANSFFVTWEQGDQPNRGIHGAFVPYSGVTRPLQEVVVRDTNSDEFNAAVTYSASTGLIGVAYEHAPTPGVDVMLVNAATAALTGPFVIATTASATAPTIGWTGSRFYLAWSFDRTGVRYTTMTSAGAVATVDGTNLVTGTDTGEPYNPVTSWSGSNGVVVWNEARVGSRLDILAARLNSTTGASLDGTGLRMTDAGTNSTPRVAASAAQANVVVRFNSLGPSGLLGYRTCSVQYGSPSTLCSSINIRSDTTFTLDSVDIGGLGVTVASIDGIVTVDTTNAIDLAEAAQQRPEIAWLGTSSLTVWEQSGDGGFNVWGRIEDGGLIPISTSPNSSQRLPTVAAGLAGNDAGYLVVWSDDRNGASDVYGARVSQTGQLLDPSGIAINTEAPGVNTPPRVAFVGGQYLVVFGNSKHITVQAIGTELEVARVTAAGAVLDNPGIPFPDGGARGTPRVASLVSMGSTAAYAYDIGPTLYSLAGTTQTQLGLLPAGAAPALAFDGAKLWLFEIAGSGPFTLTAQMLSPSGTALGAPFVIGQGPVINHVSAGMLGNYMVAAWDVAPDAGWREVQVAALYPDGGTAVRFTTAGIDETVWPALGSSSAFSNTLAYVKEDDWNPAGGAPRVFVRQLTLGDNGTPCGSPGDCSTGFCTEGVCCDQACTGGSCQTCLALGTRPAGQCGFKPSTQNCRAATDVCDRPGFCTGSTPACPVDEPLDAGTVCRPSADGCDLAEVCDGVTFACPAVDAVADAGAICQSASMPCAKAGVCDGATKACPTMPGVRPAGDVCRAVRGPCDIEEDCDGINATCPADVLKGPESTCRGAAGPCDRAEVCPGNDVLCPNDQLQAQGMTCGRAPTDPCDVADLCSGNDAGCPDQVASTQTLCRPHVGTCDRDDFCDGTNTLCPGDDKVADGQACGDGVCSQGLCVVDAGNGVVNQGSRYGFGCGCGSAGPGGLVIALLLLLVRRRRVPVSTVLLVLLALPAFAASRPRMVFQAVRAGSGVSPEKAAAVSDYVHSELSRLGVYDVLGQSELAAILGVERQKQLLGCNDEQGTCMQEIVGALDAERMVVGDFSRVDDVALLNLSLIDLRNSKPISRVGRKVTLSGSQISPLLDEVRPMILELLNADPANAAHPLVEERGFGGFVVGIRGDLDVLGPRIAPAIFAELSNRWFGGAVTLLPKASFGGRLEARFYPVVAGPVRVYVAAGATGFTTGLGIRGAVGAAIRIIKGLQASFDIGYERYVVSFAPENERYQDNAILVGVAAGWQF